jgi:hypothetical protein
MSVDPLIDPMTLCGAAAAADGRPTNKTAIAIAKMRRVNIVFHLPCVPEHCYVTWFTIFASTTREVKPQNL